MSLIFASIIGLFFVFFPMIMTFYYKASAGFKVTTSILCILSIFFAFIPTFVAFIIACIGIGLRNSIMSILFALFLIVLSFVLMAAELTAVIALIGSTL